MASSSSRIFIKGLPPTFNEADLRKHFSQHQKDVTDVKIFPNRRIGYIGYKTPEDAQKAVKYFNRTFIRMSKIGVELARPVEEATSVKPSRRAPTARQDDAAPKISSDRSKRKRNDVEDQLREDPKLKEFFQVMGPQRQKKAWEVDVSPEQTATEAAQDSVAIPEGQSDDEYESVPKRTKRQRQDSDVAEKNVEVSADAAVEEPKADADAPHEHANPPPAQPGMSDADWARSRTSRLLGLLDDEEEDAAAAANAAGRRRSSSLDSASEKEVAAVSASMSAQVEASIPTPPSDDKDDVAPQKTGDADVDAVRSSMRLFIRNLPYDVRQEDLEAEFTVYGNLEEVHVPLDTKTGLGKGFAYVQYSDPESADQAFVERDGQTFQGRLLHILPASAKRETKLDDFALSKLPLKKQQQIRKRREAAATTFNWNALYMNADAVVSSVADRLGLSKSEVLDPTSSDAAVKQAHAETHVIQETKAYFKKQGVDLDSFKRSQRGDTAILVKNIPYDCSRDELKRVFEEHGDLKRFLMPPSGIIAIVEFTNSAQCKTAFGALAYRKMKSSVLFLEKAPKDVFSAQPSTDETEAAEDGVTKISTADLKDVDHVVPDTAGTATLFVRNLNFTTTSILLTEVFKPLDGFMSARVKTKTDPKRPGEILSMGFGFLEFQSAQQAQIALQAMDGHVLEGHKLQIRASHKGADAADERRKADAAKRKAAQGTKIIIKNLPFQASKHDVRALFGAYGQLRSVRVPKKMDRAARGFAFADFLTVKEAQSAMDALQDTHLLGRRLVLEFAAEDPADAEAEIEKMQQKVGAQVNKVALQNLTGGGRKKFSTQNNEDE